MWKKSKFTVLFVVIVVVSIFLYGLYSESKESKRLTSTSTIPTPEIPKYIEGELAVSFDVDARVSLPRELPALERVQTDPYNSENAFNIAKNLGFTNKPNEVEDILDGVVWFWIGDNATLFVRSKTRTVDYTTFADADNVVVKQVTENELKNTANTFLKNSGFLKNDELVFSSFVFYETNPSREGLYKTTKERAIVYQLNYSPKITNYPLITLVPENSPVYVQVLRDGVVYRLHYQDIGELISSQIVYRLKTFDQIKNNIDEAKLISLDDSNAYLPEIDSSEIKEIVIKEIYPTYLSSSTVSTTYLPIFVLTGEVEMSRTGDVVNATLYIPAISQP
jgi:hypothetical protein